MLMLGGNRQCWVSNFMQLLSTLEIWEMSSFLSCFILAGLDKTLQIESQSPDASEENSPATQLANKHALSVGQFI
jgi:hypothetical protein